jgi:hypothetical protein
MTHLADVVLAQSGFHTAFLRAVFATDFEIVWVMAGGTKYLAVLWI